ncbi:ABC transporter substrate-binding protein [Candidatus Aerophobetes bacterium]|nr:ABC transporter substrate-binding protein [Candidatus Aerophobetes bacterium]
MFKRVLWMMAFVGLLGLIFLTPACASQIEPIRIGVISPMTGWAAILGKNLKKGVILALEEVNYRFMDRPIKIYVEDTKGQVELMITKLEALKDRDKVDVIIGPGTGAEGLAAVDWAARTGIPMLIGYSASEDITMRKAVKNVLRPGWTGPQVTFHFGKYVHDELGYKRVIIVGEDYAFPWGQAAGFIRGFLENGGQEVKRIWYPVGTEDFSAIMTKLMRLSDKYDAVINNASATDAIGFFKQWHNFGMENFYPKLLGFSNATEQGILPALGDRAIGTITSMHYAVGMSTPEMLKFRQNFEKRWGELPPPYAEQGYVAVKVLLKALEAINGKVEDTRALVNALRAVKIVAPRGPIYFDKFGNAVENVYIREVRKVNGKLMNVPVKTYKNVSQFGPYKGMEKEYMAQPPNARYYPPGERKEYFEEIEKYFGAEYVNRVMQKGWAE